VAGDQLTIEPAPVGFAAAVSIARAASWPRAIAPLESRPILAMPGGLPQEPGHDARGIPQQRAVARLVHQRRGHVLSIRTVAPLSQPVLLALATAPD